MTNEELQELERLHEKYNDTEDPDGDDAVYVLADAVPKLIAKVRQLQAASRCDHECGQCLMERLERDYIDVFPDKGVLDRVADKKATHKEFSKWERE